MNQSKLEAGAHYPERATSIQCLWNGVFTSRFIFRSDLFILFWILLKVSLTIAKAREKLTKPGFNRSNSHTEKCIKDMPLLHLQMWKAKIKRMELWEDQFKEWWLEWWKTTSEKQNTVAKTTEFRQHRFYSDFDADVTRNSKFSGKGISKNNSTCENAVARK